MKLYFKPGACSMSARIVMIELGLNFDAVKVDTVSGRTETGADYRIINPKGYVPALEIAGDTILTENPAILQYLADAHPESGLAPSPGTLLRARQQEWLNFTSSELHKAFGPYFRGKPLDDDEKAQADRQLARRVGNVAEGLSDGRNFILGDSFSVADAYLFVVLNWSGFIGFSLDRWPHVASYVARIAARPASREAMRQEGLLAPEVAA